MANLRIEESPLARHVQGEHVMSSEHMIDCDADPLIPKDWKSGKDWKIEEHQKGGQLSFDASQIELYLSALIGRDGLIGGDEFRTELTGKPVLNANVLDYLIAHPELIPEEWKSKDVFFWGTIYRDSDDELYVRFLYRSDVNGMWRGHLAWLNDVWDNSYPAAMRIG